MKHRGLVLLLLVLLWACVLFTAYAALDGRNTLPFYDSPLES